VLGSRRIRVTGVGNWHIKIRGSNGIVLVCLEDLSSGLDGQLEFSQCAIEWNQLPSNRKLLLLRMLLCMIRVEGLSPLVFELGDSRNLVQASLPTQRVVGIASGTTAVNHGTPVFVE
jgi:hypothetical protein